MDLVEFEDYGPMDKSRRAATDLLQRSPNFARAPGKLISSEVYLGGLGGRLRWGAVWVRESEKSRERPNQYLGIVKGFTTLLH